MTRTVPQRVAGQLVLAWALCLALRLAGLALLWPEVKLETPYTTFVHGQLAATSVSDPFWPPLYSFVALLLWHLSGGSAALYVVLHAVLHALIGPLVLGLSLMLGLRPRAGWLAVLGVALLPYYMSLAARQLDVGIVIVLFAALLTAFVVWMRDDWRRRWGLLFALVCFVFLLIRPNALLPIAACYGLAMLLEGRSALSRRGRVFRESAGNIALSLLGFSALLLSYASLNYVLRDHFRVLPANGGYNLYIGNNPSVAAALRRYDIPSSLETIVHQHGLPPEAAAVQDPYQRDRVLTGIAVAYMRSHPWQTVVNAVWKTLRYWDLRLEDSWEIGRVQNLLYTLPYTLYGVGAIVGGGLMWHRRLRRQLAILLVALGSYWAPHSLFFGAIRMRMTTEFLLIMLASYAADALWRDATGARLMVPEGSGVEWDRAPAREHVHASQGSVCSS